MKATQILITSAIVITSLSAQPFSHGVNCPMGMGSGPGMGMGPNPGMAPGPQFQGKDRDRMEMMVMWRLTDELQLTEEQGAKFFPDFREYRDKVKALNDQKRDLAKSIHDKIESKDELSDKDFKSTLDQWYSIENQRNTLEKEFLDKTASYLTNVQRLKLAVSRERFKNDLRNQMRHRDERGERGDSWDHPGNHKRNPF